MNNILNELYKTNLKFRTTESGIIEILNESYIPVAAIFPVYPNEDIFNANTNTDNVFKKETVSKNTKMEFINEVNKID